MKLKNYIKHLQQMVKDNPHLADLTVVTYDESFYSVKLKKSYVGAGYYIERDDGSFEQSDGEYEGDKVLLFSAG